MRHADARSWQQHTTAWVTRQFSGQISQTSLFVALCLTTAALLAPQLRPPARHCSQDSQPPAAPPAATDTVSMVAAAMAEAAIRRTRRPQPAAKPAVAAAAGGGACVNSGDTLALQRADVAGDMLACGKQCWGAENCVTACMAQREGLSQRCARCFGREAQCGRDNCWTRCLWKPHGENCRKCARDRCREQELQCTGQVLGVSDSL